MRIVLRHVTLTRAGKPAVREELVEVDVLTIGRGTDNRVQLPGLTVPLRHSQIRGVGGGMHVERLEPERVQVNGRLVAGAVLAPGDVMDVGPFAVRVLPVESDEDLRLEIEQVRRSGSESQELQARSRLGIERGPFSRRVLSWVGVALVVGFALVVPLRSERRPPPGSPPPAPAGANRLLTAWSTGPLTRAHARLATQCTACHRDAFAPVADDACLTCHPDTPAHADAVRTTAALGDAPCTSCHLEHRGEAHLVDASAAGCVACHADPERLGPPPAIGTVTAFDAGPAHPEFAAMIPDGPAGAACVRTTIAPPASGPPAADPLIASGGLRFSHRLHLQPGLRDRWDHQRAGRTTTLACTDCHRLDPTGRFMQPVAFATDCQSCHDLAFSERDPGRQLAHPAQPAAVRTQVLEFFARAALGDAAPDALRTRRRPGRDLTDAERATVLARAQRDTDRALMDLLGTDAAGNPTGACAVCHAFTPGGDVAPVRLGGTAARCRADRAGPDAARPYTVDLTGRWMPRALFSHAAHHTERCETCHDVAAAGAPTGMLPGKASCLPCHGRDATVHTTRDLAECSVCHRFHQPQHDTIQQRRLNAAGRVRATRPGTPPA